MIFEIAAGIVLAVLFIACLPVLIPLVVVGFYLGALVLFAMLLHESDLLIPFIALMAVALPAAWLLGTAQRLFKERREAKNVS